MLIKDLFWNIYHLNNLFEIDKILMLNSWKHGSGTANFQITFNNLSRFFAILLNSK